MFSCTVLEKDSAERFKKQFWSLLTTVLFQKLETKQLARVWTEKQQNRNGFSRHEESFLNVGHF